MIFALALAAVVTSSTPTPRRVPPVELIDETGQRVRLDAFRGKVLIVSFFSTDRAASSSCTAIAGKFLYLQRQLPQRGYHLLEITRDPAHDSPQRMQAYARRFGADPQRWSFLTGDRRQIGAVLRALGAARSREVAGDEPLYVIDAAGNVAGSLPAGDWSPEDALNLAQGVTPAR